MNAFFAFGYHFARRFAFIALRLLFGLKSCRFEARARTFLMFLGQFGPSFLVWRKPAWPKIRAHERTEDHSRMAEAAGREVEPAKLSLDGWYRGYCPGGGVAPWLKPDSLVISKFACLTCHRVLCKDTCAYYVKYLSTVKSLMIPGSDIATDVVSVSPWQLQTKKSTSRKSSS